MSQTERPTIFTNKVSRWFFAVSFLFVIYLAYRLVEPFLIPIFMAVVLVVVAGPFYNLILGWVGGRRALASGLTCLILSSLVALPFFLLVGVITSQALDLYTTVSHMLSGDQLEKVFQEGLGRLAPYMDKLEETLGFDQSDALKQAGELVRQVSNLLYANLASLVRGFTSVVIGFALLLFVSFYLFMDGGEMADKAFSLSPLPRQLNQRVRDDILASLRSTLKGTVVLSMIQGLAAGVGFWVFGVPNALFWGTVMVFSSVVPLIGTALVWLPAGIYLLVLGETGQAVGVMIWCEIAALVCDNILRPKLLGGQGNVHPLLTFFSVLGGLSLFGMVGLILGPLLLAIMLSLLDVYQRYFLEPVPVLDCANPPQGDDQDRPPALP
ncbi:MAG: AI-2E family transporter [Pseudomonadota bacterium]